MCVKRFYKFKKTDVLIILENVKLCYYFRSRAFYLISPWKLFFRPLRFHFQKKKHFSVFFSFLTFLFERKRIKATLIVSVLRLQKTINLFSFYWKAFLKNPITFSMNCIAKGKCDYNCYLSRIWENKIFFEFNHIKKIWIEI